MAQSRAPQTKLSTVFQRCFLLSRAFLVPACAASLPGLRGLDRLGRPCTSPRWGSRGTPGTGPRSGVCLEGTLRGSFALLRRSFFRSARAWNVPVAPASLFCTCRALGVFPGTPKLPAFPAELGLLHLGRATPPKHRGPRAAAAVSSLRRRPGCIAARGICNGD